MVKESQKFLKEGKKYHILLIQLIEKHVAESDTDLKILNVKVEITFCTNGVLIRNTINPMYQT